MLDIDEYDLLDLLTGRRTAPILVGFLTRPQMHAIGALSPLVWLSRDTAFKTEIKHRHDDLELYRLAPTVIEKGNARLIGPKHLVFLYTRIMEMGRPFRAVVKTTRRGHENFLCSIYRIQVRQIEITLNRSKSIAEGWGGASK